MPPIVQVLLVQFTVGINPILFLYNSLYSIFALRYYRRDLKFSHSYAVLSNVSALIAPGKTKVRRHRLIGFAVPLLFCCTISGCSGNSHSTEQIKSSLRRIIPERMGYEMGYPSDPSSYYLTKLQAKSPRVFLVHGYWEITATRKTPDYDWRNRSHARYHEKQPFNVEATLTNPSADILDVDDFDYVIEVLWDHGSKSLAQ